VAHLRSQAPGTHFGRILRPAWNCSLPLSPHRENIVHYVIIFFKLRFHIICHISSSLFRLVSDHNFVHIPNCMPAKSFTHLVLILTIPIMWRRSRCPCGLRRKYEAAWLLGSRVRIPLMAWMFVCLRPCGHHTSLEHVMSTRCSTASFSDYFVSLRADQTLISSECCYLVALCCIIFLTVISLSLQLAER